MSTVYVLLLVAGALVAVSLVAGLMASRFGVSHLLVFLAVGMVAGVDGPLGIRFDAQRFSLAFGQLALAVILLDGGLRTSWRSVRLSAVPASLLASVGVLLTAVITAVAAAWALDMDPAHALLMGAIVASTDAAAVFQQLQRSGARLPPRLNATLEVESGLNDPVAVFLVLACTAWVMEGPTSGWALAQSLALQAGVGLVVGGVATLAMVQLLRRLPLRQAGGRVETQHGMVALLLAACGVIVFALTSLLEGSGFLALYMLGLGLARHAEPVVRPALQAMDGYAWLAQASLFLLLGLLVTPHEVLRFAPQALVVVAVLMLVARPLAVALCLMPCRFSVRETAFVGWVGLRGAVPIVLALYPVVGGVDRGYLYFDVAFVAVVASLLLQGPSVGPLARRLRSARSLPDQPAGQVVDGVAPRRRD